MTARSADASYLRVFDLESLVPFVQMVVLQPGLSQGVQLFFQLFDFYLRGKQENSEESLISKGKEKMPQI